jgi:hypothetical protein
MAPLSGGNAAYNDATQLTIYMHGERRDEAFAALKVKISYWFDAL